jgi:hypothetical protein
LLFRRQEIGVWGVTWDRAAVLPGRAVPCFPGAFRDWVCAGRRPKSADQNASVGYELA